MFQDTKTQETEIPKKKKTKKGWIVKGKVTKAVLCFVQFLYSIALYGR